MNIFALGFIDVDVKEFLHQHLGYCELQTHVLCVDVRILEAFGGSGISKEMQSALKLFFAETSHCSIDEIVVDKHKTGWESRRIQNDAKIITVWGPVLPNWSIVDPNASLAKTAETALCGGVEVCSCCNQEPAVRALLLNCCSEVFNGAAASGRLKPFKLDQSHIRCGHESSIRTRNWIFAVSGVKLINYFHARYRTKPLDGCKTFMMTCMCAKWSACSVW